MTASSYEPLLRQFLESDISPDELVAMSHYVPVENAIVRNGFVILGRKLLPQGGYSVTFRVPPGSPAFRGAEKYHLSAMVFEMLKRKLPAWAQDRFRLATMNKDDWRNGVFEMTVSDAAEARRAYLHGQREYRDPDAVIEGRKQIGKGFVGIVDANGGVKAHEVEFPLEYDHSEVQFHGQNRWRYWPAFKPYAVMWTDEPGIEQKHAVEDWLARKGYAPNVHTTNFMQYRYENVDPRHLLDQAGPTGDALEKVVAALRAQNLEVLDFGVHRSKYGLLSGYARVKWPDWVDWTDQNRNFVREIEHHTRLAVKPEIRGGRHLYLVLNGQPDCIKVFMELGARMQEAREPSVDHLHRQLITRGAVLHLLLHVAHLLGFSENASRSDELDGRVRVWLTLDGDALSSAQGRKEAFRKAQGMEEAFRRALSKRWPEQDFHVHISFNGVHIGVFVEMRHSALGEARQPDPGLLAGSAIPGVKYSELMRQAGEEIGMQLVKIEPGEDTTDFRYHVPPETVASTMTRTRLLDYFGNAFAKAGHPRHYVLWPSILLGEINIPVASPEKAQRVWLGGQT